MSNPTSAFGWQMPTSSDLVTDLPADFEVFGQAVDTSLADLKGGTTGQILSKATNADMDFTWITNDVGDITAVTAGTGISGGGTSGAVTITNSMATEIAAKGDLIAGTGSQTFDNLTVGTNGQVLTADSTAATGLAWTTLTSGGMTLISTTTLSGASVTLSSIPSTYKNLQLFFKNMTNNTANGQLRIAPNGGTDYAYANTINNGVVGQYGPSYVRTMVDAMRTSDANSLVVTFYNYALDDFIPFTLDGGVFQSSSYVQQTASGYTYANSASGISSLVISNSGGTWSGGTVYLYGVA